MATSGDFRGHQRLPQPATSGDFLTATVKELRRANEILKAAATFFGAELDRQSHR